MRWRPISMPRSSGCGTRSRGGAAQGGHPRRRWRSPMSCSRPAVATARSPTALPSSADEIAAAAAAGQARQRARRASRPRIPMPQSLAAPHPRRGGGRSGRRPGLPFRLSPEASGAPPPASSRLRGGRRAAPGRGAARGGASSDTRGKRRPKAESVLAAKMETLKLREDARPRDPGGGGRSSSGWSGGSRSAPAARTGRSRR